MHKNLRSFCYQVLEHHTKDAFGKFWENFLALLILTNVIAATLETIPTLHVQYSDGFFYFEFFSVMIFTVEYFLRIWSIVESRKYQGKHARLRYVCSPFMLFDLLVIIPFYLQLFFPLLDTRVLRVFRLIRIMRVLRIGRFSLAAEKILRLVGNQKSEIFAVFFLMIVALLVASTGLYFAEHTAQPEIFSSIPATFWWGIATLTTIGYGDMVPITPIGKMLASITAFFGVAIFALPTAIIGASFYRELASKNQKKLRELTHKLARIKQYAKDKNIDLSPAEKKT
jgi:voltage-gated potassium channel